MGVPFECASAPRFVQLLLFILLSTCVLGDVQEVVPVGVGTHSVGFRQRFRHPSRGTVQVHHPDELGHLARQCGLQFPQARKVAVQDWMPAA